MNVRCIRVRCRGWGASVFSAAFFAAWLYPEPHVDWQICAGVLVLMAVSLIDDFKGVRVVFRFAFHLASAFMAVAWLAAPYGFWPLAIGTVFIAWMTNLYNFMDGSDGLAGGMAFFGFSAYGGVAALCGDTAFAAANFAVAAAALGFLAFNFPPARIFMGDVGSIPLGYLAAVFGALGWARGEWPLWFGVVVFSPFIVDASVTLGKRLARRVRVWEAHREHYYQRLIQAGWGHRKTALAEYGLMIAMAVLAAAVSRRSPALQAAGVGGVIALYAIIVLTIERKFGKPANHA